MRYNAEQITHYDTMSPTVVATGDSPKSFLSSSVPLQIKHKANSLVYT